LLYFIILIVGDGKMKEKITGARGQSADGNYRRPYGSGQLPGKGKRTEEWGGLFRKAEVGGWDFRFLVGSGRGRLEFSGEKAIFGLVRRLQQLQVFEIEPRIKELD
jgi:hypothetical protein